MYKYFEGELMIKVLNLPLSNNLMDISSVKYIFVPIEDTSNDANPLIFYGKSRQYYINQLNKLSYLKKINIGTKNIVVYENSAFRPHIYVTVERETITKNVEYKTIEYKSVNPTEYTFFVKKVSTPFTLNFSESYNAGWNLRVGSFNWFSVLTNKNYFVTNNYHSQNDANLNSYYINPETVCSVHKVNNVENNGCVKNADGSYDILGTLYFAPQSYMYLGLIISGVTLVAAFSYLLFVFGRNVYVRKNK